MIYLVKNIIYLIDESGDRIGTDNWTGEFDPDSTPDNVWLKIIDENSDVVLLKKGDWIHYSDGDLPQSADYIIEEASMGIYKVRKIN